MLEVVTELFIYDKDTGLIKWKNSRGCVSGGDIAGCLRKNDGYLCVRVNKRLMLAHRLAWMIHYKEEPPKVIDHINHVKTDNRIDNLRAATKSQNGLNRTASRVSKSGRKGVFWDKNKWMAQCVVMGKTHYLGRYDSIDCAAAAYDKFAAVHHKEFFVKSDTERL